MTWTPKDMETIMNHRLPSIHIHHNAECIKCNEIHKEIEGKE